jgi:hypothetical protein
MVRDRAHWRALLLDLMTIQTPQRQSAEYEISHFIVGCVTTLSISRVQRSVGGRMSWEDCRCGLICVLVRHLPRGAEENNEDFQSGSSVRSKRGRIIYESRVLPLC